jgi:hypothetical protein
VKSEGRESDRHSSRENGYKEHRHGQHSFSADAQGRFSIPDLPIGNYELQASRQASKPWRAAESLSLWEARRPGAPSPHEADTTMEHFINGSESVRVAVESIDHLLKSKPGVPVKAERSIESFRQPL